MNAPSRAQWTFCAKTGMPRPTAAASDVNAGQTTTSTPVGGSNSSRNATVSAGPLNIFQLPATSTRDDLMPMPEGEIQYTRSGEYHIAYRVDGDGAGGIDVLYVGAYVFSLALRHPPSVQAMREKLAALGRLITFDGRGMGLSDRLRDHRLPPLEERMDDARAVLDDGRRAARAARRRRRRRPARLSLCRDLSRSGRSGSS